MSRNFTREEKEIFDSIIECSSFIPCNIEQCIYTINFLVENKCLNSVDEPLTLDYIADKYFDYIAWHSNKYPDEQYVPKESKLKSFEVFLNDNMFNNYYKIEIKHSSREDYLFGEQISSLYKKYIETFKELINIKYKEVHGKQKK